MRIPALVFALLLCQAAPPAPADDPVLWRVSAGPGARIQVPTLGHQPLALDFEAPLLHEEDDER